MSLGPSDSQANRVRVGLLCLAVGVVLMLWAWGNWFYRSSVASETVDGAGVRATGESMAEHGGAALGSSAALLLVFLIFLVFLVGSYALVRWSRRFREVLLRTPAAPTPSDDLWSKHKLRGDEEDGQV